jgi:hypothetical protein
MGGKFNVNVAESAKVVAELGELLGFPVHERLQVYPHPRAEIGQLHYERTDDHRDGSAQSKAHLYLLIPPRPCREMSEV